MAESRRGCTPAQQSMCSSNPLAFTSRFSAVAAEQLISRHAPCHKHLFLVQKFYSRRIPRDYRENHHNSCEKAGIPANSFSTREGRSAGENSELRVAHGSCGPKAPCRRENSELRVAHGSCGPKAPCRRALGAGEAGKVARGKYHFPL